MNRSLLKEEAATIQRGREMAVELQAGDCLVLVGDLGAGKTHLTKGIVAGLGSRADVTSPTFSLVHEYADGRLPIFHFDFYRLDSVDALLKIGWDDYLDAEGVMIVEWGDKFPEILPETASWWSLSHDAQSGGRELIALGKQP